jgi:hypothetical protein
VRFTDLVVSVPDLKQAAEKSREDVLATWNGGSLTVSSFASRLNLDMFSSVPPSEAGAQITSVLHDLVDQKLTYAEARATGCDNVPQVVRKVRKFREGLMENVLYGKYILPGVKVADAEVREYFDKNPGEFVFPESRNVAQILIASSEAANEVKEKIRGGQAFGSLAKAYSTDPQSKDSDGVVGWFEKSKIPPALEPTVWALNAGEVGEAVKTEAGYHILKVVEIRSARPKEFPEAKKEIEKKLLLKKSEEKVRFWLEKLKAVSEIEIREPL